MTLEIRVQRDSGSRDTDEKTRVEQDEIKLYTSGPINVNELREHYTRWFIHESVIYRS